jgi:hypothetical protein
MRIKGEYLQNLPVLVNQWAEDIDRLDIRIRTDNTLELGASTLEPLETLESTFRDSIDASRTQ